MDIQIDTREKQRAVRKILKTFDDNGVKHFSSKLLVGDYMSLDNPRLIIDRKQNLQELCGNVCQQHERFKRELLKHCTHIIAAFEEAVYDEKKKNMDVRLDDGEMNVDSLDSTEYSTESIQDEIMYIAA